MDTWLEGLSAPGHLLDQGLCGATTVGGRGEGRRLGTCLVLEEGSGLTNAEGPKKGKWAPRDLLGRGLIPLEFEWVRRVSHQSPQKERRPGY